MLFDEVEKAHPDVFNILLQVLDDGRITDSQGRTVDFKNTIIILTSNLGSQYILDGIEENGDITGSRFARRGGRRCCKRHVPPRVPEPTGRNRVLQAALRASSSHQIVRLMIDGLNKRLADKQLSLEVTDAAVDYILDNSYDPSFGARPIKRYLQRTLETMLARKILAEDIPPRSRLKADVRDGELTIELM